MLNYRKIGIVIIVGIIVIFAVSGYLYNSYTSDKNYFGYFGECELIDFICPPEQEAFYDQIGCGCKPLENFVGKLPSYNLVGDLKPGNLSYCESDSDCVETYLVEDSCCTSCGWGVNLEGDLYLKSQNEEICPNDEFVCPGLECFITGEVICEENRCIVISNQN